MRPWPKNLDFVTAENARCFALLSMTSMRLRVLQHSLSRERMLNFIRCLRSIPAERLLKSRVGVDMIRAKEICTHGRTDTLRKDLGISHRRDSTHRANSAVHRTAPHSRNYHGTSLRHVARAGYGRRIPGTYVRDGRSHRAHSRSNPAVS